LFVTVVALIFLLLVECIKTMQGHDHVVSAVVFMPSGEAIVSCSRDHAIKVWDVNTGYCSKTLHGHSEWVRTIAVSSAGDLLLSGGEQTTVFVHSSSHHTIAIIRT
jgi:platelet-activating factor acetylhydrolase IB subunit alpha